jgi:hypothetical protein
MFSITLHYWTRFLYSRKIANYAVQNRLKWLLRTSFKAWG